MASAVRIAVRQAEAQEQQAQSLEAAVGRLQAIEEQLAMLVVLNEKLDTILAYLNPTVAPAKADPKK